MEIIIEVKRLEGAEDESVIKNTLDLWLRGQGYFVYDIEFKKEENGRTTA